MIHYAQIVIAYMLIAGLLGFLQDRILIFLESLLLRWKR